MECLIFKFLKNKQKHSQAISQDSPNTSNENWTLNTKDLLESSVDRETEDKVFTETKVIGHVISNNIPVNMIPKLKLTPSQQIALNRTYTNRKLAEEKSKVHLQRMNDLKALEYSTLRTHIYNLLDENLTFENKVILTIDTKFEEYLSNFLEELKTCYIIREFERNPDIVKLDETLPYKFEFKLKAV